MNSYKIQIVGDVRSLIPTLLCEALEETSFVVFDRKDLEHVIRAFLAGYSVGLNFMLPLDSFTIAFDENGNGAGTVVSDVWRVPFEATRTALAESAETSSETEPETV